MEVLASIFDSNSLWRWVVGLGVALAVYGALRLLKALAERYLTRLAGRLDGGRSELAAELLGKRTNRVVFLIVAVYAGSLALELPAHVAGALRGAAVVALFVQAALWGNGLINHWIAWMFQQRVKVDPESASAFSLLSIASRIVLWTLVLLSVLHNVGIDITAFVAGLGVAGIAVALAVQNVLGDLFAALSIILDKPFVVGDFIIVGEYLGTVERIGLKTTRIRSLSGEQLVFSNNDLLNSRIRNYKRMQERRVAFSVGVTYQTPYEKLAAIPSLIREIVEAQEKTRFDRAHFQRYGDFALIFEVVYYVTVPDYNTYMDIQQAINLEIYRRFALEGIEFAYPTQTVYLARAAPGAREDRLQGQAS
ncbi:MAG: mechanosensitive ion channel family protein [Bacillota bacterium]